ncbi:MAG: class I SAM-dependent methyltransferase [Selenomonadaceae bacterium]|nr:class I SAM-dependent methyltransferase [Selenomonadaceae bacterium]
MHSINEIELYHAPRENMLSRVAIESSAVEMTDFDSAFLCGLIKKFRPRKLLELGVASGGTTAVMLQCLSDLNLDYEFHSVDISPVLYTNNQKRTGYIADLVKETLPHVNHKLHLGHGIPYFLPKIGGGIDFVLLDTTHFMPGEVLDFIAVLPYLTNNAVVCVHDIAISQAPRLHTAHACSILFSSVTARKFMNYLPPVEVIPI